MATVQRYVNTASSGGDGTTNGTAGATAAYASLSSWEANSGGVATDDYIVDCCGTAADTTPVTIDFSVNITSGSITVRSNRSDAAGFYTGGQVISTSHYRLTAGNSSFGIIIQEPNITLDGLQITIGHTSSNGTGIRFASTTANMQTTVQRCRLLNTASTDIGIGTTTGLSGNGHTKNVRNNLVVGFDVYGIAARVSGNFTNTSNIYHNTVYGDGAATGIYLASASGSGTPTFNVVGNAVANSGISINESDVAVGTINRADNACADGTGQIALPTPADAWTSPANSSTGDFTVKDTSSPLYNAVNPTVVTFDITDFTRDGANHDVGAFEFQASGSIEEGAGATSGTGTAAGVGASTAAASASSSGIGTVLAVGLLIAAAVGGTAGSASTAAAGAAAAYTVGTSAAEATASAVSGLDNAGAGVADGVATASTVGVATAQGAGAAAGSATVDASSQSSSAVEGSSTGEATAAGVVAITAESSGLASGVATATGIFEGGFVGTSTGASTAAGAGSAIAGGVGTTAGIATADAVGVPLTGSFGTSNGTSTSSGVSAATIAVGGSASGAADVDGALGATIETAGSSTGTSTAAAAGETPANETEGSATGSSTAAATGAVTGSGSGTSTGASTASSTLGGIVSVVGTSSGSSTAAAVGNTVELADLRLKVAVSSSVAYICTVSSSEAAAEENA